jgi:hypothetical protein
MPNLTNGPSEWRCMLKIPDIVTQLLYNAPDIARKQNPFPTACTGLQAYVLSGDARTRLLMM